MNGSTAVTAPPASSSAMALRPYQSQANSRILSAWDEGFQRVLLVLPTGCGKTICFSDITCRQVAKGERVLILAHRGELLDQAADKLAKSTGLGCAVEKADETALDSWYRVTVGSVQTLMRQTRLEQFPRDHYSTIIVDEAHHALSKSYQTIFDWFNEAKILGVTATPDRGDKKNLGAFFQTLAYEYTLPAAIRDGYLSPIRAQTIPLQIDLSQVKTTAGDFSEADLGKALEPYLTAIADEMAKACAERKTLVFLPLISTSKRMRDLLVERGFRAGEVNGESTDRAETLERFHRGEYNCLCNSMLLTEGYDEPAVDCIVCLRPTKIRSLYAQIVGRGTRLSPGKDHLLLLDFLWNSERHELCRPAYLVAESEEVAKRMTEKINEEPDGAATDIQTVMEEVLGELVNERELALAKQLAEMRHRKRALVDPLQYAVSIQAEDLVDYVPSFDWEMAPASKGQLQELEKSGIFPEEITCAGMAAKLLERLQVRRASGFATPKQVRILERFDYPHAGNMTFTEANKLISRLAANGWRKVQ